MSGTCLVAPEVGAARSLLEMDRPLGDLSRCVRDEILASWHRCSGPGTPSACKPEMVGDVERRLLVETARSVVSEVFDTHSECPASILVIDAGDAVCLRVDGSPSISAILNAANLKCGSSVREACVGTNAGMLALIHKRSLEVIGPEHWKTELSALAETAVLIRDGNGATAGVLVLVHHVVDHSPISHTLARVLAGRIEIGMSTARERRVGALAQAFAAKVRDEDETVLATDGTHLFTHGVHMTEIQLNAFASHAKSALLDCRFTSAQVMLPTGTYATVQVSPVTFQADIAGCILTRTDVRTLDSQPARRQGAHAGIAGPRDYSEGSRIPRSEADRLRNQQLLNPFAAAREMLSIGLARSRNLLLTGESGTGKGTLAATLFSAEHPGAQINVVDCSKLTNSVGLSALMTDHTLGRRLIVLRSLNRLDSVMARRLDELMSSSAVNPIPPTIVGCVDVTALDPGRPFAVLNKHFSDVVRVPALRYRVDDIGDIARSILDDIAVRHSFRLSMQVVRIFEGYSWPGNISELRDVLKHVVETKPFGMIQPADLPTLQFHTVSRKLSPLDTAQCDTIIQALYEAEGNRYEAAVLLGISRSSLYRKIDAFGISYIG